MVITFPAECELRNICTLVEAKLRDLAWEFQVVPGRLSKGPIVPSAAVGDGALPPLEEVRRDGGAVGRRRSAIPEPFKLASRSFPP